MTTTTALATTTTTPTTSLTRGIRLDSFDDLQRFCKAAAASGFFRDAREIAQAIVKVQYGLELGIGPIAAMQGVHCIEGKLCIGANLIAGRIKNSGRYDYRIVQHTNDICVVRFFEGGAVVGESSFSLKDAQQAGVASKSNWKNYPRNMLFSRAISNGARWYCPDVFAGPVYTPDEIGDGVAVDDIEPAAPTSFTTAQVAPAAPVVEAPVVVDAVVDEAESELTPAVIDALRRCPKSKQAARTYVAEMGRQLGAEAVRPVSILARWRVEANLSPEEVAQVEGLAKAVEAAGGFVDL